MIDAWKNYLNMVIPMYEIDKILLYSDSNREWIANALVDMALDIKLNISMAHTDEFSAEDIEDVIKSIPFQSINTLIIILISKSNQNNTQLKKIFPYNKVISNYKGYSIVFSDLLPNPYIYDFLSYNYNLALNRREYYQNIDEIQITNLNHKLHVQIEKTKNIDFMVSKTKQISFPGTEIRITIKNYKISGEFYANGSISPFIDENMIQDYFGPIPDNESFTMEINDGVVESIDSPNSNNMILKRFKRAITGKKVIYISIGIGHNQYKPVGINFVDRNMGDTITMVFSNNLSIISYNCKIE